MNVPKLLTSVTMTSVFGSLLIVAGSKMPKLYQSVVVLVVERRGRGTTQVTGHRNDTDERGDGREHPDRAVRGEGLAVSMPKCEGTSLSRPIA